MLFLERMKVICLMVGLLAISGMGIRVMAADAAPVSANELFEEDTEMTVERIEDTLETLLVKEAELKRMLQEKEAVLDAEDEEAQIEVMNLQEAVREIRLEQMMLRAKMEK